MRQVATYETAYHYTGDIDMPSADEKQQILLNTLEAATARANPYQSNYHVMAAAMNERGDIATGGNREKTFSDAWIHGETSAVNNLKSRFGETAIKIISFYSESRDRDQLLTCVPCGPCRDTLLQETSPDLLITNGNEDIITIARLRDFLKDDFTPGSILDLDWDDLAEAEQARMMGDGHFLSDELLAEMYGVSLVDQDGQRWRGGLETTVGYNALSPGYAARIAWRNTINPGEKRPDLKKITVTRQFGLPTNVEYRDRQALYQFDRMLMRKFGRQTPLPVDLVHMDETGPVEAVTTDTHEWLPRPFGEGFPSMEITLEDQVEKLNYLETMEE